MKPSTLTALALTLLMLLLVLLSAFIFLFQGQLTLRDNLAGMKQKLDSAEAERATLQFEQFSLQAIATEIVATQAASASESLSLTTQLAKTDLTVTAQASQSLKLLADKEITQGTREFYETRGPLVSIIEPQPSAVVNVDEVLVLRIVASDAVGVKQIYISIDNNEFETKPVPPDQVVVVSEEWTPVQGGQKRITVRAVNNNNVPSRQSAELLVFVNTPTPTSTPTSTSTPTATATSTATATPTP